MSSDERLSATFCIRPRTAGQAKVDRNPCSPERVGRNGYLLGIIAVALTQITPQLRADPGGSLGRGRRPHRTVDRPRRPPAVYPLDDIGLPRLLYALREDPVLISSSRRVFVIHRTVTGHWLHSGNLGNEPLCR